MTRNLAQSEFSDARRVVIKIGSAQLVGADGMPNTAFLTALAADIAALNAENKQVVLVSSGAVALGRRALGYRAGALKLEEKQAAAAAGQSRLIRAWEEALGANAAPVAQVLLTVRDVEQRRSWLNARATLNALLDAGAIPIVNENDSVATQEIRYGDNDRLAARVAQLVGADILFLLSDIDGLYTADPRKDAQAEHLPVVSALTPEIMAMGGGVNESAGVGSGGMATKLEAARIAFTAGCSTVIALGAAAGEIGPISTIRSGGRATWFVSDLTPETARLQWLAGNLHPSGALILDPGAVAAVLEGNSLLPAGVTDVRGQFERGDAVELRGRDMDVIGLGVSAYSSEKAKLILGRNSSDIEAILGFKGRPALIHRDDLVLIDAQSTSTKFG